MPKLPSSHGKRIRGHAGVALRESRLRRTNGLCEDCKSEGRVKVADVVDHIRPLALGGQDVDSNTRNLCHEHHDKRTAEQFGRDYRPKVTTGADGWPINT